LMGCGCTAAQKQRKPDNTTVGHEITAKTAKCPPL